MTRATLAYCDECGRLRHDDTDYNPAACDYCDLPLGPGAHWYERAHIDCLREVPTTETPYGGGTAAARATGLLCSPVTERTSLVAAPAPLLIEHDRGGVVGTRWEADGPVPTPEGEGISAPSGGPQPTTLVRTLDLPASTAGSNPARGLPLRLVIDAWRTTCTCCPRPEFAWECELGCGHTVITTKDVEPDLSVLPCDQCGPDDVPGFLRDCRAFTRSLEATLARHWAAVPA